MKISLFALALISIGCNSVFADVNSNSNTASNFTNYSSVIHKGVKIAVDFSNTRVAYSAEYNTEEGFDRTSYEAINYDATTFLVGYQDIAPSSWGYSVLLERTKLDKKDLKIDFYLDIIEGNATYGLSEKWYMAFGGNLSKYTSSNANSNRAVLDKFGVGYGTQFAFGFQPIKNLSIETKMMITSHTAEIKGGESNSDSSANLFSSALKLGIAATF